MEFKEPNLHDFSAWKELFSAMSAESLINFKLFMLQFQSSVKKSDWVEQRIGLRVNNDMLVENIWYHPFWVSEATGWLALHSSIHPDLHFNPEASLKVFSYTPKTHGSSHYDYLDLIVESFDRKVFCSGYKSELCLAMVAAHGDKAYQYFDEWAEAGISQGRGSLLYLMAYTTFYWEYKKIPKVQWVIDNYRLFLPYIIMAEKEMGIYEYYKRNDDLPPLEQQTWQQQNDLTRYVVTAANRYGDILIVGARHFSPAMRSQLDAIRAAGGEDLCMKGTEEQGFIDQWDVFMTRKEAFLVAQYAGQINTRREKSGTWQSRELFSEDIH